MQEKLKKLEELYNSGILTLEELNKKKAQLISENNSLDTQIQEKELQLKDAFELGLLSKKEYDKKKKNLKSNFNKRSDKDRLIPGWDNNNRDLFIAYSLQLIPLFCFSLIEYLFPEITETLETLLVLVTTLFFVFGLFLGIKYSFIYTKMKGYSRYYGLLSFFSFFGLAFIFLLPDQTFKSFKKSLNPKEELQKISTLHIIFSLLSVFIVAISIGYVITGLLGADFEILLENKRFESLLLMSSLCMWGYYIKDYFNRKNAKLEAFGWSKRQIDYKNIIILIVVSNLAYIAFNLSTLYYLSFVFPEYVEDFLNLGEARQDFMPIILLTLFISAIFEEFIFRGVILHKLAVHKNIVFAVVASSFLSSLLYLNHNLVIVFLLMVIASILYLKTKTILSPIIFNLGVSFVYYLLDFAFFDKSISLSEWQIESEVNIPKYILILILSLSYVAYFIYLNFPSDQEKLPYIANQQVK